MSDLYIDLGPNTPESLSVYTKAEADAKYLLNTTDSLTGNLDITGNLGVGIASGDGPLHVWSSSAGTLTAHADGNDLVLETSGQTGMSIMGPDASEQVIFFASPSNNRGAFVRWRNSTNVFAIGPNNSGGILTLHAGAFGEVLRINNAENVGIGTGASIDGVAKLQVDSTTKGFLPPRMTTTQRDAISSPPAGLMIYNTSTDKLNVYTTAWEAITSA
jgi:hypothetical protein